MPIARILFGYRDDLNLPKRWWHRLLVVFTAAAALVVSGVAWAIVSQSETNAAQTVEVIETYLDFVKRGADQRTPILPVSTFAAYAYGVSTYCNTPRNAKESISAYTPGGESSFCTKPELADAAVVEASRISGDKAKLTVDLLLTSTMRTQFGVVCVVSSQFPDCGLETIASDKIVANPLSSQAWLRIASFAFGGVFIFLVASLNFYHRIILYVVFGRRQDGRSQGEGE